MKTCECGNKYVQYNTLMTKCAECLVITNRKRDAKKAKAAKTAYKKETRDRKKADKTLTKVIKELQPLFNEIIRLRDYGKPCISCGRSVVEHTIGGKWDCGHYIGRGANTTLRFQPLNAHLQCKSCNGGSAKYAKKGHTVGQDYRIAIIEKIGLEDVEWLEGPHDSPRWTKDSLAIMRTYFLAIRRELKKDLEL